MPLTAYWNPDDENHRNWKENFGFTEEDTLIDNKIEEYQGEKKLPVIRVEVSECSYVETVPEWINVLTGEELGTQDVTINVEAHIGTYYFGTRTEYDNWITNTLNNFADAVDDPDGETNLLTLAVLPDLPSWSDSNEE